MAILHRALASLFAALLNPLTGLPPLIALTVISAVGGVLILLAFRFSSNPSAVRQARQRAQAHLLAVRLYRDDVTVVLRSQRALVIALGAYLGHMLVPFVVLLLPFALLFAHLDARYGARALHPGERAIVKATALPNVIERWQLAGNDNIVVETPAVRIPRGGEVTEIVWRIRAEAVGCQPIVIADATQRVEKQICVATDDIGAAERRASASLDGLLAAPVEPPIADTAGIMKIEIGYPPYPLSVFGWHLNWVVIFLVVSAVVALLLRKPFRVEF
jgi:hypothetical protein